MLKLLTISSKHWGLAKARVEVQVALPLAPRVGSFFHFHFDNGEPATMLHDSIV